MNIRTKLFIGYLIFTATLVILGVWSAWHLREMGGVSRNIIANNYDSTVAAQDMRDSLERQSSAALFALLGQQERALAQLTEYRRRFDASFQRAANNITEPGEADIIEAIRRDRKRTVLDLTFPLHCLRMGSCQNGSLRRLWRCENI